MGRFIREKQRLLWQEGRETLWAEPWGKDGIRVRVNVAGAPLELPQALIGRGREGVSGTGIIVREKEASLKNGALRCIINTGGLIRFENIKTGKTLLEEKLPPYYGSRGRRFIARDGGLHRLENWFTAYDDERLYGLGQHKNGRLNQKGCVINLEQRNSEISIPFALSSRGYGFLWNNPGIGRVEFGADCTRWVADGSRQIDYWVVCGETPAEILEKYADATGHAPEFPGFASGFWQCRLRYENQAELLRVVREHKRRGLPLSVIVIDFFHWTRMGDWKFDPKCWPDPAGMVKELDSMGVRLMVSIWPTAHATSENWKTLKERGLLIENERGTEAHAVFVDNGIDGPAPFSYYDATNPEARKFIWDTVRKNYCSKGVKLFWLDCDEPDVTPMAADNLRLNLGNGVEVLNSYPLFHQQAFDEGLRATGEKEPLTLSRSAWAGSQRFSSVVWSGDIRSTFEVLQQQVRAGLNMALSGIPWWTTDIGGFEGGDITTDYFKELIVRWFQYGVFCPVFRLHGYRLPLKADLPAGGANNETWSFGETAYKIIRELLFLRERLRPYIHRYMKIASKKGLPLMRPLFVDFPKDKAAATVEDQFMFGPDILVAPVLHQGEKRRAIYLPKGTAWTEAENGRIHEGGLRLMVDTPLETIPVFVRKGSRVAEVFKAR